MIILLWLLFVLIPGGIGIGLLSLVNCIKDMAYKRRGVELRAGRPELSEGWLVGFLVFLGVTELAHLAGTAGDLSLKSVGLLLGGGLLALWMAAVGCAVWLYHRGRNDRRFGAVMPQTEGSRWIPGLFLLLCLGQVIFIYCVQGIAVQGDITLETVQSFLAQDGIYRAAPLTGQPYTQGLPLRYEILCLPTLYAVLSCFWGIDASLLVQYMIPVVTMAGCYLAYYRLSGALFGRDADRRYTFLILVGLLLWFSESAPVLDGYGLLHGGYMGTSVRNLVLVPFCLASCLEKKWGQVLLCILAEACISWTFWGLGVCLAVTAGMAVLTLLVSFFPTLFKEKKEDT